MPNAHYSCDHCGHWHIWFQAERPPFCIVCTDVRNALPPDRFAFASEDEVAGKLTTKWREYTPGLWGFWCEPKWGLGATGWLLQREDGNVAFEGAPNYSDEALDKIAELGGVAKLGTSHPHGYGAVYQLQRRFDPLLFLHREDLKYSKAFRVTTPTDDFYEVAPGLTLHHTAGHYEGHAVLYDESRKALFCGDALKFEFAEGVDGTDGTPPVAISCHKGYHYQIPLSPDEIRKYIAVFERLPFTTALTPFEYARGVTREHAIALYQQLLEGAPHTQPVRLDELGPG